MKKERSPVPFDKQYFKKQKDKDISYSRKDTFTKIYETNHWSGGVSVSGEGADHQQTRMIQGKIPELIKDYSIKTILDLPCGDFNWMKDVDMGECNYIGADIVDKIIDENNKKYRSSKRHFLVADITGDILPDADLIISRDCLVHLSNEDIMKALENIGNSKIQYLLTTTFTDCNNNEDIITGDWRIINLQKAPFNLPDPLMIINEGCTEGSGTYSDKSLGLWDMKDM